MSGKINDYGDDQIKVLTALQGMRQRVAMYFGSNSNDAIMQIIKEGINNFLDEYLAGFGTKAVFKLNTKTNEITMRDYGRSTPFGKTDQIFMETHASGKYDQSSTYGIRLGQNGTGASGFCSSGQLTVISHRDGEYYTNSYNYKTKGEGKIGKTKEPNGLLIRWIPDNEYITDLTINPDRLRNLLENFSYVVPNFSFHLTVDDGKEEIIKSKSLSTFLTDYISEKDMISKIMTASGKNKLIEYDLALVYTKQRAIEKSFINLSETVDHGTHVSTFKTAWTREINKILDYSFTGEEIRRNLCFILSVKSVMEPVFKSQSKDCLNMPDISKPLSQEISKGIIQLVEQNRSFFEAMKNAIEQSRKKDSTALLMKTLTAKTKSTGLSDVTAKYKGCTSSTGVELFICEGDSAAGGLNLTKSSVDQATYAARGKVKNVMGQDLETILQNEELKGLIKVLGTEKEALAKYKAIVLAADRDPDGDAIINLMLGFLCTFYPGLLTQGRVFIPELPLYSAMNDKGEKKFFNTEEETRKLPKSWHISYLKGLGEVDPADLGNFTTNRKTRKLIPVEVHEEDLEEFSAALEFALSKDKEQIAHRREFLIM